MASRLSSKASLRCHRNHGEHLGFLGEQLGFLGVIEAIKAILNEERFVSWNRRILAPIPSAHGARVDLRRTRKESKLPSLS